MNFPKIGVGVMLVKDGKFLLQKRKGSHGEGTWSFPGGHLEHGETIEECAKRETREETGIHIEQAIPVTYTEDFFPKKHYITIFVHATTTQDPKLLEPEKALEQKWFLPEQFPTPLFLPIQNLLAKNPDVLLRIQKQ